MEKTHIVKIDEQDIKDLKNIRNYFGINDETIYSHFAFKVLDNLVKNICDSQCCVNQQDKETQALDVAQSKGEAFNFEVSQLLDKTDDYLMLNTKLDVKDLLDFKDWLREQLHTN